MFLSIESVVIIVYYNPKVNKAFQKKLKTLPINGIKRRLYLLRDYGASGGQLFEKSWAKTSVYKEARRWGIYSL